MGIFFMITNTILTLVIGMGIYSFSHSIFWAVSGAFVLMSGSVAGSPILALIAYPIVEWIFSKNGLSIYSAMSVGITLFQMAYLFNMARKNDYY